MNNPQNFVQRSVQNNIKIAVVDRDENERDKLIAYFKPKGYDVFSFSTVEEAQAEVENAKWDIFLLNLEHENVSNLQLIQTFKKIKNPLQIIVIISTSLIGESARAVEYGACDVIVKPTHLSQLHIAIEKALYTFQKKSLLKNHEPPLTRDFLFKYQQSEIIGTSPKLIEAMNIAKRVAFSEANVFISGESGCGKEVFAKHIHSIGNRAKGPFIAVNCSAIPESLLESELFGHAKGAFTGAIEKKIGLFEEAENGTLFLDEIGDLTFSLQAKLLRVLQEKKIKRVGENDFRPINARIISATHKNLANEVKESKFREDLFFRLNVVPVHIPSLKDRVEDILPLAEYFLYKYSFANNFEIKQFSEDAKNYLITNSWKGNVRELENAVERAVVMCTTDMLELKDFLIVESVEILKPSIDLKTQMDITENALLKNTEVFKLSIQKPLLPLQKVVQKYIEFAINRNGGAKDRTAKEIGIDRKTLYRKMKSFENYAH